MWGRFLKHVGWALGTPLSGRFPKLPEISGNFRKFPEILGSFRKIQEFPETGDILYGFPSSFSAREVPARPPAASGWR